MVDIDAVIAWNIAHQLKKNNKSSVELAENIGIPKQDVDKILSGSRMATASELNHIADYFGISMDELVVKSHDAEINVVHSFMRRVKSNEAREALVVER